MNRKQIAAEIAATFVRPAGNGNGFRMVGPDGHEIAWNAGALVDKANPDKAREQIAALVEHLLRDHELRMVASLMSEASDLTVRAINLRHEADALDQRAAMLEKAADAIAIGTGGK